MMLTILAWLVFIPAAFWNVIFWCVAFATVIESKPDETRCELSTRRNLRDAVLSASLLLIPGVYLFGWV